MMTLNDRAYDGKINGSFFMEQEYKTRENSNFWKRGKIVILDKIQNFSKSRMMKRISPLESSCEI